MRYAYAVFFTAFTGSLSKPYSLVYRSDAPIMTGEGLAHLTDEVARTAVSNRFADSVASVVINNVSLVGTDGDEPGQMPVDLPKRLRAIAAGPAQLRKTALNVLADELEGKNAG